MWCAPISVCLFKLSRRSGYSSSFAILQRGRRRNVHFFQATHPITLPCVVLMHSHYKHECTREMVLPSPHLHHHIELPCARYKWKGNWLGGLCYVVAAVHSGNRNKSPSICRNISVSLLSWNFALSSKVPASTCRSLPAASQTGISIDWQVLSQPSSRINGRKCTFYHFLLCTPTTTTATGAWPLLMSLLFAAMQFNSWSWFANK